MKLYIAIITLLFGLMISAVAAYFSVVGLGALFQATFIPVIIMGTVLEAGKLWTTGWLHTNWKNKNVSFLHKTYLMFAILALCIITALGIYGYLSKGHTEQSAPLTTIELQIKEREQKITQYTGDNERLTTRLNQLDQSVNTFLKNDKATQGLKARTTQKSERDDIQKQMDLNYKEISKLNDEILPLKLQTADVEAKLGPVKYVAALFGLQDPETAVRMVILIIMFAFDPLAIFLVISSTITFSEYFEEKRNKIVLNDSETVVSEVPEIIKQPEIIETVEHEPVIEEVQELEPVEFIEQPVLENKPAEHTDREQLLAMLENKPELLDDFIEAVMTSMKSRENESASKIKPDLIVTNVSQSEIQKNLS